MMMAATITEVSPCDSHEALWWSYPLAWVLVTCRLMSLSVLLHLTEHLVGNGWDTGAVGVHAELMEDGPGQRQRLDTPEGSWAANVNAWMRAA
jgi:hypothetical protein